MIATLRTAALVTSFAALAAGCGSNVRLDPPTIPEPVFESLPVSVGVRMPENFEHFVHEENVLGSEQWTIDLGRSNAVFFSRLFYYMFDQVTILDGKDDPPLSSFDAVIEPSIEAFEFSVPNQTKTDAFAVWIRYRVKVFDREGEVVANWPLSAYGKAPATVLGGSDALRSAAVLAMRDAAALMIIKFDEQHLAPFVPADTGDSDSGTATALATTTGEGTDD